MKLYETMFCFLDVEEVPPITFYPDKGVVLLPFLGEWAKLTDDEIIYY